MVHRSIEGDLVAEEAELSEASAVTRRSFMVRTGAAGAALSLGGVLAACGGSSGSGGSKTVVYAGAGGTTRNAQYVSFWDPFLEETGIRVVAADFDDAKFMLMSRRGRSQWDSCEFGAIGTVQMLDRRLLEQYPEGTRASDSVPDAYKRCNPGVYWPSMNVVYRPEAFRGPKPSTWEDFWNVKKFPGRRCMRIDPTWMIESALLADGVPMDRVQPYDFDRGFAKLDELKPYCTFVTDFAETQQLLQNGDVDIAQLTSGRAYPLLLQGVSLVVSWEQALHYGWGGPVMPHGAPHEDAMVKLAEFMTIAERQAAFAKLTGYGPANTKALELLDDALIAQLPNTPEHLKLGFHYDFQIAAQQQDEYTRRVAEWAANA